LRKSVELFAVGAARAAGRSRHGFIHDLANGTRAAATLRAAAQTAVDLTGRTRRLRAIDRGTNVAVSQHVAGADDHGRSASSPGRLVLSETIDTSADTACAKKKRNFYTYSNLRPLTAGNAKSKPIQ
jgi:hypothetical protein